MCCWQIQEATIAWFLYGSKRVVTVVEIGLLSISTTVTTRYDHMETRFYWRLLLLRLFLRGDNLKTINLNQSMDIVDSMDIAELATLPERLSRQCTS